MRLRVGWELGRAEAEGRGGQVAGRQGRTWDLLPHLLGSGSHGTDSELRALRSPTKVTWPEALKEVS